MATCAGGLNAPYTGSPTGCRRMNHSRARQPQANGRIATVQRAAVRAGSVTGVTPVTGSLALIERVSQNVAIMPNPPRKAAVIPVDGVDLGDVAAGVGRQDPRGQPHGDQEDRVDGEPAHLPDGERGERGPAGGGFWPGGRERSRHDATSSRGS